MRWSSRRMLLVVCTPKETTLPRRRRLSLSPRPPGSRVTTPWRSSAASRAQEWFASRHAVGWERAAELEAMRSRHEGDGLDDAEVDRVEALADELGRCRRCSRRGLRALVAGRGRVRAWPDRPRRTCRARLASDAARRARLLQARLASRHAAATVRLETRRPRRRSSRASQGARHTRVDSTRFEAQATPVPRSATQASSITRLVVPNGDRRDPADAGTRLDGTRPSRRLGLATCPSPSG